MGIARQTIEEVKLRVPIEEVVAAHVVLKRSGRGFVGLSPFSNEKTPSFHVYPDKNFYYCFSTSQGGDLIDFVRKVENLPFQEAVEHLANRYNIEIAYEGGTGPSPEERSLRKQLLEIHEQAAEFYHNEFFGKSAEARKIHEYWITERGFSDEVAREFKIGLAPPGGAALQEFLAKKGFSLEALSKCGLFYVPERVRDPRSLRPRFRGRLMIPIRDHQGQIVAFTARQTALTPRDDPAAEAKYVNSPETDLFHKSQLVFNLDRARTAVGPDHPFLLVEGQLDAIRCWSSGLEATIAFQGSAITERQIQLLRRYHDKLLCLFDGDAAGTKAGMAVIPFALKAGMDVRFLTLPPGSDPDSLLREQGREGFARLTEQSRSLMHYALDALLPKEDRSPRVVQEALWKCFPMLADCDSAIVREALLDEAISRTNASAGAVREDFRRFLRRGGLARPGTASQEATSERSENQAGELTTAESNLLFLILHHDWAVEEVTKVIDIEWINHTITEGVLLGRIMAERQEGNWNKNTSLDALLENEEERNCYFSLLAREHSFETPVQEINKCLERIFRNYHKRRIDALDQALRDLPADAPQRRTLRQERAQLNQARLKTSPPCLLVDRLPENA